MIRNPDHRLVAFVPDELDLVFDVENRRAFFFLASRVPDGALDRARVSFFPVLTQIRKLHPLFPISIHRHGTVKVFLAPALATTVQAIGTIV